MLKYLDQSGHLSTFLESAAKYLHHFQLDQRRGAVSLPFIFGPELDVALMTQVSGKGTFPVPVGLVKSICSCRRGARVARGVRASPGREVAARGGAANRAHGTPLSAEVGVVGHPSQGSCHAAPDQVLNTGTCARTRGSGGHHPARQVHVSLHPPR